MRKRYGDLKEETVCLVDDHRGYGATMHLALEVVRKAFPDIDEKIYEKNLYFNPPFWYISEREELIGVEEQPEKDIFMVKSAVSKDHFRPVRRLLGLRKKRPKEPQKSRVLRKELGILADLISKHVKKRPGAFGD